MKKNLEISCLIPAKDEEKRIRKILEVLGNCSLINKIIVVDDGSGDKTAEVVKKYPVRLLQHQEDLGKGAALQSGISEITSDFVIFLDADLVNLKEKHLLKLLDPLIQNSNLSMTIGTFRGGRFRTDLAHLLAPSWSGIRALRREFYKNLPDLSASRYGVDIKISQFARKNGFKIKKVKLFGLTHPTQEEKLGLRKGLGSRLKMYREVIAEYFKNLTK